MSYFGEHYPFYVPPHISGYEKVKMSIMNPISTKEMEQRIKMRYAFAMSSFGRMFLPRGITPEMQELCKTWSKNFDEQPPIMKDLYQVDRYFLDLWRHRQQ